jgi:hypothetical protein
MWLPRLLLVLLCLLPTMALSQGAKYSDYTIDSAGHALGGIQIRVCSTSSPSTPPPTSPCSPLATLYTDQTLLTADVNPLTSDAAGNFSFYAPTGFYILQFYQGTQQVFAQTVQVGTTNTNTVFNATIGYQINNSFGTLGQCITSTGTGSQWGTCGGGGGGGGISIINPGTMIGPTITFAAGTSGTDFGVAGATNTITYNLPTASATNRGALSSADWTTFNSKQATISVSAPITLVGASVGMANQGTTTTVLHGNAAGNPTFGAVTSADTTGTFAPNAHNLLSATHGDTTAAAVVLGDIVTGQAGPSWKRLAANATATKMYLQSVSSGVPSWQQIAYADVSGTPTLNYQTVQQGGAAQTQRPTLNFISGSNATVACVDNAGSTRTDCTISSSASAGAAWDAISNPTAGGLTLTQFANGNDFWTVKRKTDTSPTGSFFRMQTAAGVDVCALSITGVFSSCSFPYANVTGTPTLFYQTVQNGGVAQTQRPIVNLISGSNATVSCVDNSGSTRTDCTVSASAAAGSRLDQIAAATAGNTINSADNAQVWNWSLTTASKSAFTIGENIASTATGTPILFNVQTLSTSTLNPFQVTAGGTANGIRVSTVGVLAAIGTGHVNADQYKGGTASGTGGCINQVVTALNDAAVPTCTTITSAFTSGTFSASAHNLLSATHGDATTHSPVLGDVIFGNATPAWAALAGNTSSTKQYLSQTGTGTISASPAWAQVAFADLSGTAATGQIPATVVYNNQANTYSGGGLQDLSAMKLKPPTSTVAGLPAAASNTNIVYEVTDGNAAGDCTVGTGTTRSWCGSNGANWIALGDGGGGGGGVSSVSGTANQIASTGGTTPVLSITNPFIFPGKATFAASTVSNPSFNIPSGTAPTTPAAGDCWLASNIINCVAQTGVSTAYLYYDSGGVNARTDDTSGTIVAYTVHHPLAAPTINSQETTDACAGSPPVCTESWSPVQQILRVTADFTTAANTNFQTPSGMSITLPANTALNMAFDCHWSYSQATAAADSFGIQSATIAPTSIMGTATMGTSATAGTSGTLLALASTTATAIVTATPTGATNLILDMHGMVENPSNASANIINFMVKQGTAANVIVIKRGSWCKVF